MDSMDDMVRKAAAAQEAKARQPKTVKSDEKYELGQKLGQHGQAGRDAYREENSFTAQSEAGEREAVGSELLEKLGAALGKPNLKSFKDIELTPELRDLLDRLQKEHEAQEAHVAEIRAIQENLGTDPLVAAALNADAEKMAQLKPLYHRYDKVRSRLDGGDASVKYNSEYKRNIEISSDQDPLCTLQNYGQMITNPGPLGYRHRTPEDVSVPEAQKAVELLETIADELAKKHETNLMKVDNMLTEFLAERIRHMLATLSDRVDEVAREIYRSIQREKSNPGWLRNASEEGRRQSEEAAKLDVEGWRRHLLESSRTSMPKIIELISGKLEKTMSSEGYRARAVAQLGAELTSSTLYISGGRQWEHFSPFHPDSFEEAKQREGIAA